MTRRAALTGLVLFVIGLAAFLYKAVALGVPVTPSDPADLWHVELTVSVRGTGAPGSVRAALPRSDADQVIFDERTSSDGMQFSARRKDGERWGVWTGKFSGVQRLVYGYRAKLGAEGAHGGIAAAGGLAELRAAYCAAEVAHPSDDPVVRETVTRLSLPPEDELAARIRTLHAFVLEEVSLSSTASDDALLALTQNEGTPLAKARLLVTLLRAARVPAQLARGLKLSENAAPRPVAWAEAWNGQRWISVSPTGEFFGERPRDLLLVHRGSDQTVSATAVAAVGHRYDVRRERLRPDELATLMTPPNAVLRAVSLHRLPIPLQKTLGMLLLLPLGALLVAVFRNLIGIVTNGTFMPILIALALRTSRLWEGLLLLALVVAMTTGARVVLRRIRLMVVPRLGVLLCIVVLAMCATALFGLQASMDEMFATLLFPVVILTMFVERFSLHMEEEGTKKALITAGYTLVVAMTTYPVFRSDLAVHVMFGFPELTLCVMGMLIWIGGYAGYRLLDLVRFKSLAEEDAS